MADEHKGFANTHYPGMRIDPNDGNPNIDPRVAWRYEAQTACVGEGSQRELLESSVFVVGATPLGVAIAKKLMLLGLGRVGLFGDEFLVGAHGFPMPESSEATALPAMAAWAAAETPWVKFERFRTASIDRSIEDMARGFRYLVTAVGPREAGHAVTIAGPAGQTVVAAQVCGRTGWCAAIPAHGACEKCLRVPELIASESAGLYFPLVDHVAGLVSTILIEASLGVMPATAFVESIDATRAPWLRETTSVQRCCAPTT